MTVAEPPTLPPLAIEAPRLMLHHTQLAPNPWNRAIDDKDPSLLELGRDIAAKTQIYPCIVRPNPQHGAEYQIVLGERRWRACRLLEQQVKVEVHNLDDKHAVELIFSENMQRKDLSPLEESAAVCAMLDNGWRPEEVADRCGKPLVWVHRRARLNNLSRKWLTTIKGTARHFSALMLEEIALLPKDNQDSFLDYCQRWQVESMDLARLRAELAEFTRELVKAPWDVNDAKLPGGACASCDKRTGCQPHLFEEKPEPFKKGDRCLDRGCWERKHNALLKRAARDLEKQHGKPAVLFGHRKGFQDARQPHTITEAKATDKDAVPALNLDTGQACFVKRPGAARVQPERSKRAVEAHDRKQAREAFEREEIGKAWRRAWPLLGTQKLAALAASYGALPSDSDTPHDTLASIEGDKEQIQMRLATAIFDAFEDACYCSDEPAKAMAAFHKFARIDLAEIKRKALEKFPEPKRKETGAVKFPVDVKLRKMTSGDPGGGGYHARGAGVQVSCTAGDEGAVEALLRKLAEKAGVAEADLQVTGKGNSRVIERRTP